MAAMASRWKNVNYLIPKEGIGQRGNCGQKFLGSTLGLPGPEIHPADLPELRPVALPAGDAASAVTLAQCGSSLNAGQDLLYLRMFAHMYRTFLELPNGQC